VKHYAKKKKGKMNEIQNYYFVSKDICYFFFPS
jgi:hypothetical protein